jgi:CRP-like cAMP-binding protein
MDILNDIIKYTSLSEASAKRLTAIATKRDFRKGTILVERGRVFRNVYIIGEGVARAFHSVEGEERNFWIGAEGETIFSPSGITLGRTSPDTIETVEYCVLYHFDYDDLRALCHTDVQISNWWIGIVEIELFKAVERLTAFTSMNATERYLQILQEKPWMIQRIPQVQLASYLGITPQSLSRIRAKH